MVLYASICITLNISYSADELILEFREDISKILCKFSTIKHGGIKKLKTNLVRREENVINSKKVAVYVPKHGKKMAV